jgi:hypothetical protein
VVGERRVPSGEVLAALARRRDAGRLAAGGLRRALLAFLARSSGFRAAREEADAALASWLRGLGVRAARRDAFLAACGLDEGAARALGEDLALEAAVLGMAERFAPDGPGWHEGLALEARLTGAWVEEALRLTRAGSRGEGARGRSRARGGGSAAGPRRRPGRRRARGGRGGRGGAD